MLLLAQKGRITTGEICEAYGVSEMTARRDLRDLDRIGLVRKVHGGAVSGAGRSYEPPYALRSMQGTETKAAIGRKAAQLISDGDSIALDVGTTTLEIARALRGKRNLTIITQSLPIAAEITSSLSLGSDVRLILTGGVVRPGELSMIGDVAEQTYHTFHVDKAFIGVGGLSLEDGLTEYNVEDALVKRHLLKSAQKRIVVAEGRKLGRTTFTSVGPLSAIDVIVTDSSAPEEVLRGLSDLGIDVILADSPGSGAA